VFRKLPPAQLCNVVTGIWFAVYKAFLYLNEALLFQRLEVAGKVTVGNIQQLLEGVEIERFTGGQHTHDAQPRTVLKRLVEFMKGAYHRWYL